MPRELGELAANRGRRALGQALARFSRVVAEFA
jgi:hypothetical protein